MEKDRMTENRAERYKIKGFAGCVLLAAGFILLTIARMSGKMADWYGTYIYAVWVNTTGRLAGIFPFSVSEILIYGLLVFIFIKIVKERRKILKKETIADVLLLAGILVLLYVLNCGINYHRTTFSESSGITTKEYTVKELKEVCLWLTEEVNQDGQAVKRDGDGVMEIDHEKLPGEAVQAMEGLGEKYEELAGYYPKPKPFLLSGLLSVQGLSGIYLPLTVEANYNQDMTDYNLPFTACHELSHLRGFMEEKEANFIGFLACKGSDEETFRYSGSLMGWLYCMNVLYEEDYDAWEEVREQLSPEAEADLAANSEFWAEYEGTVEEVSNKINDTYLKANGQEDGVESYDRMVDLIVSGYLDGTLKY